MTQKIIPHLWYDHEAFEAASFYVETFKNASITDTTTLFDTPSGNAQIINFRIGNLELQAISAGPFFKFTPAISLMYRTKNKTAIQEIWHKLIEGGDFLMPLSEYPFSDLYGWVRDRYGLTWQIMYDEHAATPNLTVNMLYSGEQTGVAEEAAESYIRLFNDGHIDMISYYQADEAYDPRARVNYLGFQMGGLTFSAMDHGYGVDEPFNEAFSLVVLCDDQAEIDRFWEALSYVKEAEQCGWLRDRFGVSWQIVPKEMSEWMSDGTQDEIDRMTQAFLKMKKLELATIARARKGEL